MRQNGLEMLKKWMRPGTIGKGVEDNPNRLEKMVQLVSSSRLVLWERPFSGLHIEQLSHFLEQFLSETLAFLNISRTLIT